ncbi:MAG: isochorismate synthase [Prevotella sp.]|nr:isochorismate synthase [Prevotella sp.]
MSSYAIYRLPYEDHCTLLVQDDGQPEVLQSYAALNGKSGFVIAPFSISPATPLLLLHPEQTKTLLIDDIRHFDMSSMPFYPCKQPLLRTQYSIDYSRFHSELLANHYEKLVLSRCLPLPNDGTYQPLELFIRACQRYPRLFISLVSTEQGGTWLTATPEILLDGKNGQWRTIALAGTMKLEGKNLEGEGENATWSTKNIQEQRYVATYLAEQLKPFASDLHEEGPRTVRAANLIHLRSDFIFTLIHNTRVGDLLQTLHPTPAVCGLPKEAAAEFIMQNESVPRLYYSGFMGPLNIDMETHLYVTLRCMHICPHEYRLYAGGGILKESTEQQEWLETEAKMETMARLLDIKSGKAVKR